MAYSTPDTSVLIDLPADAPIQLFDLKTQQAQIRPALEQRWIDRKARQPAALFQRAPEIDGAAAQIGWGLQHQPPESVHSAVQRFIIIGQSGGVFFRMPRKLFISPLIFKGELQIIARLIPERPEIGDVTLHNAQAALIQTQIGNDLWVQKTDRVGRR